MAKSRVIVIFVIILILELISGCGGDRTYVPSGESVNGSSSVPAATPSHRLTKAEQTAVARATTDAANRSGGVAYNATAWAEALTVTAAAPTSQIPIATAARGLSQKESGTAAAMATAKAINAAGGNCPLLYLHVVVANIGFCCAGGGGACRADMPELYPGIELEAWGHAVHAVTKDDAALKIIEQFGQYGITSEADVQNLPEYILLNIVFDGMQLVLSTATGDVFGIVVNSLSLVFNIYSYWTVTSQ